MTEKVTLTMIKEYIFCYCYSKKRYFACSLITRIKKKKVSSDMSKSFNCRLKENLICSKFCADITVYYQNFHDSKYSRKFFFPIILFEEMRWF